MKPGQWALRLCILLESNQPACHCVWVAEGLPKMKSWRVGKLSLEGFLEASVNTISVGGLLYSHCTQLARLGKQQASSCVCASFRNKKCEDERVV